MHTHTTYILAVHAAEPGVDAVLLSWEIVFSSLYADVYGASPMNDVANMSRHVHSARGTAIVISAGPGVQHSNRGLP